MRRDSRKNPIPPDKRLWLAAGLIVLAVGYVLAQPTLERWLGIELPSLVDHGNREVQPQGDGSNAATTESGPSNPSSAGENGTERPSGDFNMEPIGRDAFRSPAGLVYSMGPNREHRIDHILRHAVDDPDRRGPHGVFLPGDRNSVLQTIDDAWRRGKAGGRGVQRSDEDGRTVFTVDMGKTIGYVGGRDGASDNHPKTTRLKLVVDGDRVITAYPTWPRR
jgi:hypothetical protein